MTLLVPALVSDAVSPKHGTGFKISQGGLPLVLAIGALLCSALILPTAWADTETGKITESFRGSRFGQDVAISNDIAVVGASEEFDQVSSAGAGYIYRKEQTLS